MCILASTTHPKGFECFGTVTFLRAFWRHQESLVEVENWSFILFWLNHYQDIWHVLARSRLQCWKLEPGGWVAPGLSIGNPSSRRLGTWRCFLTSRLGSLLNFSYLGSSLYWSIWLNGDGGKGSSVNEYSDASGCRMNGAQCTVDELLAVWEGFFCAMGKPGSLDWERHPTSYVWLMS